MLRATSKRVGVETYHQSALWRLLSTDTERLCHEFDVSTSKHRDHGIALKLPDVQSKTSERRLGIKVPTNSPELSVRSSGTVPERKEQLSLGRYA